MDTVTPIPDRKTIEAEACAWITQLDGAEPSQEDLMALREWMNRSPAHREAIERLSSLWDDLNVFTELAVPRTARARPHPKRLARNILKPVAATALILLTAIGVVLWQGEEVGLDQSFEGATTADTNLPTQTGNYETVIGAQRRVDLADGSRITLNTDSRIEVHLHPDGRDVRLVRGEALFEVAGEPGRPFRVIAGNGLVRAVGTAFTVYLKDSNNVFVTVAEGEVELAAIAVPEVDRRQGDGAEVPAAPLAKIKAGQVAAFGLDIESIRTLEEAELTRELSWRDGMLRFDGEPLYEAVAEVSRYTTQEIIILDPALRDLRIGGYFKVGETEAMFDALESSFGVRVDRISENLVHLRARR